MLETLAREEVLVAFVRSFGVVVIRRRFGSPHEGSRNHRGHNAEGEQKGHCLHVGPFLRVPPCGVTRKGDG